MCPEFSRLAVLMLLLVTIKGSYCWQILQYGEEGLDDTMNATINERWSRMKLQNKDGCGRRPGFEGSGWTNKRIVGGYPARMGEFPSFVSLKVETRNHAMATCGGTIVHPRVVLTAAHCLGLRGTYFAGPSLKAPQFWHEDRRLKPILASNRCRSNKFVDPEQSHDAADIRYDYGVLILEEPIKFGPNVQPACLPSSPIGDRERGIAVGVGLEGNAEGYQVTAKKLNALPVQRSPCMAAREFVCFKTFDERYVGDSCAGDSGGPTYVMRNGKQVLVSLISYGPSTCQRGVQGISYNSDIFKEMAHVKNLIKTCAAQVGLKNLEI